MPAMMAFGRERVDDYLCLGHIRQTGFDAGKAQDAMVLGDV
jgi:hypothetical protein